MVARVAQVLQQETEAVVVVAQEVTLEVVVTVRRT